MVTETDSLNALAAAMEQAAISQGYAQPRAERIFSVNDMLRIAEEMRQPNPDYRAAYVGRAAIERRV